MALTLHVFPSSPRAFKVLLTANHVGIDYTIKLVNLLAGDQRSDEHTRLNANQRMPVLQDDDYVLWESNAILEYLAAKAPRAELMPADVRGALSVRKWLYWESAHWDPACAIFVFERVVKPMFAIGETSQAEIDRGTPIMARLAKVLNGELEKQQYVAGNALSLADLCLAASFIYAEQADFPLQSFGAIRRWLSDMQALPAWKESVAMQASKP